MWEITKNNEFVDYSVFSVIAQDDLELDFIFPVTPRPLNLIRWRLLNPFTRNFIVQTITITRPDDWHVHFRDGEVLHDTVNASAKHFARALVMPNLKPALTNLTSLIEYRKRILAVLPANSQFIPLMTYYLNEHVSPDELTASKSYPFIVGAKFYPAGATTNSDEGTDSLQKLYPFFKAMQQSNHVLEIHGEVTYGDIFERQSSLILDYLEPLIANFPRLRIVLEHISTKAAVDFVINSSQNVAATITPHHLMYNRNDLLAGGIRPHYYCLPILKHHDDQLALQKAATSGNPKFFAGTDSAPHPQQHKEQACGCAGIYSAPFAVAMYTQLFDELNQLEKLNAFMSRFGANFYQLPINKEELLITKKTQTIPAVLSLGNDTVIPVAANQSLSWSIE